MRLGTWGALLIVLSGAALARAQFGLPELPAHGVKLGAPGVQRWKTGIVVRAGSPCLGVYATVPVPTDWPEQQVKIVAEDFSPKATVSFRTLDNGVKQLQLRVARLEAGETAHALITYEVTKSALLPPDDPAQFVLPKRSLSDQRDFLGTSPYIETRHPKIRSLARQLVKDKDLAWDKVEAIYDWVRENVEYKNGDLKGALAALRDGDGDCEELTSLFIAMCRANRIPARTVWVPGHCYPEFYLEDAEGQGHWFPCQAAGTRDFGGIPDQRPILQKGDNIKVPELKKPVRYTPEYLEVKAVLGSGDPQVQTIREVLPAE